MRKLTYTKTDPAGNEIRVYKDLDIAPHVLEVFIYIQSEGKERKVGIINKNERTLHLSRNRSKHLHLKSNSYGINYALLNEGVSFDTVIIRDEIAVYKVPRETLLKDGQFIFFKQQGFEKQIFVPLSVLDNYTIKEKVF